MARAKSNALDLRQLQMQLEKQSPQGIYFLVGEESYLVDESIKAIKNKFLETATAVDFNFEQVYSTEVGGESARDRIETLPMMSPQRMVIIRGAQSWKEKDWQQLLPILENPVDSCVVVIEAEKVDKRKKSIKAALKNSKLVELKAPYDNQLPQWVHYMASQNDLQLGQQQVQYLIDCVGTRLVDIRNEIIKLKQFVGESEKVTGEQMKEVVSHAKVHTVFELTDALGARDKRQAMAAFNNLVEHGQNEVGVVNLMARHIRMLRKTVSMVQRRATQDMVAKELGVHKFFVSKYIQQAKGWTPSKLESITEKLYEVDGELKSSPLAGRHFVESLILGA